jgi:CheY-like chemotaxis protein
MLSKSILIVEDDVAIRDVLKAVITSETAHQVFIAPSSEIALSMLETVTPNLFLVDYMLPGMNGTEFIEKIRQNGYKHTPIVLITACLFWQDVTDVQVLRKPFELTQFLQVVEECLNGA